MAASVEVVLLAAQEARSRTALRIKVGGRMVTVSIATKPLRKVIATICTNGIGDCV